jgi:hypothetical protein
MENKQNFYSELERVPEVPDDIYPALLKKIQRRKVTVRSLWLLAACVVLVIAGLQYVQFEKRKSTILMEEVVQELQEIEDYFSCADIEQDSTLYSSNGLEAEDELPDIIDYFTGENVQQDVEMYAIIDNDFL